VLVVLIVNDVTTGERGLRQVIREFLFLQRQLVEAGHLVAQHFDIGKAIDPDVKRFFRCDFIGLDSRCSGFLLFRARGEH